MNSLSSANPLPNLKAYELFTTIKPSVLSEILNWFRDYDKNAYKTLISSLASDRKLRPAFVQKKSIAEQYSWVLKTLQLKSSEGIGLQVLQTYLLSAQQSMLAMFCDGLGIPHDGKGSVIGQLPKDLDSEKLDVTIDKLLSLFDAQIFILYLHCFNMQVEEGYSALNNKLSNDERLKFA